MKLTLRLPMALMLIFVMLAAATLSACSRPLIIDEDKESMEAAQVLTHFILDMANGDYSKAFGYFDSTYSDITVSDLSFMVISAPTLFSDVEKVEVTSFTAKADPNSKSKILGTLVGIIHYGDDSTIFHAEMVKDNDTWYLIIVNFAV